MNKKGSVKQLVLRYEKKQTNNYSEERKMTQNIKNWSLFNNQIIELRSDVTSFKQMIQQQFNQLKNSRPKDNQIIINQELFTKYDGKNISHILQKYQIESK